MFSPNSPSVRNRSRVGHHKTSRWSPSQCLWRANVLLDLAISRKLDLQKLADAVSPDRASSPRFTTTLIALGIRNDQSKKPHRRDTALILPIEDAKHAHPLHGRIIKYSFFLGQSVAQIAAPEGLNPGIVEKRHAEALGLLRKAFLGDS